MCTNKSNEWSFLFSQIHRFLGYLFLNVEIGLKKKKLSCKFYLIMCQLNDNDKDKKDKCIVTVVLFTNTITGTQTPIFKHLLLPKLINKRAKYLHI